MNARVNINTQVAVVLTKYGAEVYNRHNAPYAGEFGYPFVKEGQQLRLPLWEVMRIFGKSLEESFQRAPFENNEIEFLR